LAEGASFRPCRAPAFENAGAHPPCDMSRHQRPASARRVARVRPLPVDIESLSSGGCFTRNARCCAPQQRQRRQYLRSPSSPSLRTLSRIGFLAPGRPEEGSEASLVLNGENYFQALARQATVSVGLVASIGIRGHQTTAFVSNLRRALSATAHLSPLLSRAASWTRHAEATGSFIPGGLCSNQISKREIHPFSM
jgi:hypothetical protein